MNLTASTPPCLNDLEMADLIAGRLEGEYRDRALRHLADCEDCFELYAEAQALHAELDSELLEGEVAIEPSAPIAQPLPFRPKAATPKWLPSVAAGLAVGIALAWLLPSHSDQSSESWATLGELPRLAPSVQSLTPIPSDVDRGPGSGRSQTAEDFRFGAEWAHLEAALSAGEVEESRETAKQLQPTVRQLKGNELPEDLDLPRDLETLLKLLAEPNEEPAPTNALTLTPRLSKAMSKLGYEFDLGRFAEAGRLAAEVGQWLFFEPQGEAARYLREMQKQPVSAEAAQGLEGIAKAWPPKASAAAEPYPEAAQAFEDLILGYQER